MDESKKENWNLSYSCDDVQDLKKYINNFLNNRKKKSESIIILSNESFRLLLNGYISGVDGYLFRLEL
jgi:hypothetical protein